MKKMPFCPPEDQEPAPTAERMPVSEASPPAALAPVLNACVLFCDVFIAGKDTAVGLKYEEENMFVPMIVIIERDACADAVIRAAGDLGVPVINNIMLAKNLASYGKAGESIPEASFRDVSLLFSRLGPQKRRQPSPKQPPKSGGGSAIKIRRPVSVELGESLFALTGEEPGRERLMARPLAATRKKLVRILGLDIPPFRICLSPKLKADEYRILFKGLEAGRGRLELGWYSSEGDEIPTASYPEMMSNPANIRAAARAVSAAIVRHVNEIIQRRAPELLGRDEVQAILDTAEEKYPVVTGEVKSLLPLGSIREIFQGLVSEQVSIRHIAIILEILADWASFGPAPSEVIIEQIRQSLKRQICLEYADDKLTLRVLTLEPKMDKDFAIRGASVDEGRENSISLAVRGMEEKGLVPVILCSPKARLQVKEATRRKIPNLAVLSYMEIPPDIKVEPVGEIRLKG
ncbi:MAG: FHIPEP family type III secretion protein [Treponema sp.]|nr:FHIPEP family type III secretion protein [Treponema sp.]